MLQSQSSYKSQRKICVFALCIARIFDPNTPYTIMENMYSAWEAGLSAEKKYSKDNIFHKK
jgi:hypothetical protein